MQVISKRKNKEMDFLDKIAQNTSKRKIKYLDRDEFFFSAVFVPFIDFDGETHLLFEKRSLNIRQGGEVSFPGGRFEASKDQDFRDTAIRETLEELNLAKDDLELHSKLGTVFNPMGNIVEVFLGRIHKDFNLIKPSKKEVEQIFLVPLEFFQKNQPELYSVDYKVHPFREQEGELKILFPAKQFDIPKRYQEPWRGLEKNIYLYQYHQFVIWGLTATIVKNIIDELAN